MIVLTNNRDQTRCCRQSELIQINLKKGFNLVWCNLVENQSVSIRINPRFWILTKIQSDSIQDFQFEWIRKKFSIRMNPISEWFTLNSQSE